MCWVKGRICRPIQTDSMAWAGILFPKVSICGYNIMAAGPGFATTMRLYPEKGLGIVILANGTDLDRDGLADRLTELLR